MTAIYVKRRRKKGTETIKQKKKKYKAIEKENEGKEIESVVNNDDANDVIIIRNE